MRVKYDTNIPFLRLLLWCQEKSDGLKKGPSSIFFSRCGMAMVVRISTLIAIKYNNKLQSAAHTVWAAFVGHTYDLSDGDE